MYREILFKGKVKSGYKDVPEGEWVEGSLLQSEDGDCMIAISCLYGDKDMPVMVVAYEVYPETVCQYTGYEKNEKKIFEGDILKYHFGKDTAPIKFGPYQNCIDSQDSEHCGFYVDWTSDIYFRKGLGYWVHMVDAEIIGNINDNQMI